ncbi:hypothetical protein Q9189_003589 [Teloschistes chrysophthalmus]
MEDKPANMAEAGKQNAVLIDNIRINELGLSILDMLRDQFRPEHGGERRLPTLLLYDEQGLKLFEEISYLEEYYLTNAEIEILQTHASTIAAAVPEDCVILELGSGNLRKVKILLDAIESAEKNVDYYALDLSQPELERTLSAVPTRYQHVRCHGLFGTYDDGLSWLKRPNQQHRPKWILSLGSSVGNFRREEAASFLEGFANAIGEDDAILVGLDACQDGDKIYHAYNDRLGTTHQFLRNGLVHANRLLNGDVFQIENWQIIGEYDQSAGRHQGFYRAVQDAVVDGEYIKGGTKIRVEESYKYSSEQSDELWRNAGLVQQVCFGDSSNDYYLHVLARPTFGFPLKPAAYAAEPVPSFDEWTKLWAAWDLVTQRMLPDGEVLSKPIKLRNSCVFYLGHIPTFLDIHLTKATGGQPTEPSVYQKIFERGIDPDVDNPEKCHAHSEIPEEWPPVAEILGYQARVRSRVKDLTSREDEALSSKVGRALWLGFEHEDLGIAMHLETLLYMLLQSDKTLPPPGAAPNFQALARTAQDNAVSNEWIGIPSTTLDVGLHDPEDDLRQPCYFGWDNEKPIHKTEVPAFQAKARPLTNEDYVRYLCATERHEIPASWVCTHDRAKPSGPTGEILTKPIKPYLNGHSEPVEDSFVRDKCVRTVYGPVSLEHALAWPVYASYDELAGCAKWMNGRIPTADEVRSIYSYVDRMKTKEAEKVLTKKISAVNGHLSNDGVEETPPSGRELTSSSSVAPSPDPHDSFADLERCNVGLSNFHPTPVTQFGKQLCGRGEMGGVWEWTSTTLEKHDGFEAMRAYPGYTEKASKKAVKRARETYHLQFRDGRGKSDKYRLHLRCRKSAELHDKRHREIANFILKIRKIDEEIGVLSSPSTNRKKKTRKSDVFTDFGNSPTQVGVDEESDWADASTLNEDGSEAATPCTPNTKENFSPRGPTKAERRRARQSRLIQIISPELMRAIDSALHPILHSMENMEGGASEIQGAGLGQHIIQDNIKFNSHNFRPGSMRQSVHAKKLLKANGIGRLPTPKNAQEDPEITLMLVQLDIATTSTHATRERVNLVRQLRNAIRDDLDKVDNENRDTMTRMAGYWRYVNRKTYNYMVRHNHIWDWATGQKLEEVEEDEEEEVDTEDGHDTDGASWSEISTAATPLTGTNTPIEDYTGDFILDEMKTLQLVDNTVALDAKLNAESFKKQAEEDDPTTPKMAQFPTRALEPRSRSPIPMGRASSAVSSPIFPSSTKDTRHIRPSSIATVGTDVPLIKLSPAASTSSLNAALDLGDGSDAHDDPNNRYNALKNDSTPSDSISQRRGRANKTIRLSSAAPAAPSPLRDTTNFRSTATGKALGAGTATYAAALKKGT